MEWAPDVFIGKKYSLAVVVGLSQQQFGGNSPGPVFSSVGLTAPLQIRNNGARTRDDKFPQNNVAPSAVGSGQLGSVWLPQVSKSIELY